MLTTQILSNEKLISHSIANLEQLKDEKEILWLALKIPSEEDRNWLTEAYKQDLPTEESICDIETCYEFFIDEHGLHFRNTYN